ncbi:hypothetical protein IFM89_025305 [Coptis chinensis]|uniref:Copper transport protein n=1 Tax=Coptis chinensis TaxID=261450 RepID=A0A835HH91_9MAGN|nr:hypothetical protein IFM89_025305 [Coptis chinensis]
MDMGSGSTSMQMTFYWGKDSELLFSGFPGEKTGMYVLALILVFVIALLVEFLSHTRLTKGGGTNYVANALVQTFIHGVRVGLAFLVMLAVMSFNVGVLIAAVSGHTIGFLFFGTALFR